MTTECLDRLDDPRMAHYHALYAGSPRWDGVASLAGKRVIVYCEQGTGDTIQFARYLTPLRAEGCFLILHGHPQLRRLLAHQADDWLDKDDCDKLPSHDYHVLSLSLPFTLRRAEKMSVIVPYLYVTEAADLGDDRGEQNIGIAWEGNPEHATNFERCCPLEYFKELAGQPGVRLFMLQKGVQNRSLARGCDAMDLYGLPIQDFYDTAVVINAMDVVVSVDTAVLHLAGALGKKTYGLLPYHSDPRWAVRNWYPTVQLLQQAAPYDWDSVFDTLYAKLGVDRKVAPLGVKPDPSRILLTGGIGDIIALESYMSDEVRADLADVYYATRAARVGQELFAAVADEYPRLKTQQSIWDDYSDYFAFYSKGHCEETCAELPEDWGRVTDWSIYHKFVEVQLGRLSYNGSSFLKHALADISGLPLPDAYVVVCPFSGNNPKTPRRNFSAADWDEVVRYLESAGLKGVVLSADDLPRPRNPLLVDLTRRTTVCQSIEVLKRAKGYLGIDSWLSVLAAKLFDEHLFVKSRDRHLAQWRQVYYAPKTDFGFIGPDVKLSA